MGYYSEVGLVLSKKGMEQFQEKIDSIDPNSETYQNLCALISNSDVSTEPLDSGEKLFHWDWIKWYESFSEIAFFETLMDDLDPEDFLFLRVGESIEDVEEKGAFCDNSFNFNLIRSITFDAPYTEVSSS